MARGTRKIPGKRGRSQQDEAKAAPPVKNPPTGPIGLPLPSPVAGTNLVIADIALRAAGRLLRDQMEKGLLRGSYDKAKVDKLVHGRGLAATIGLWGASHIARRSPIGLAVVIGGLAAKVVYDRGKRLEGEGQVKPPPDAES